MNRSLIADRYAKALFKLAHDQANLERVYADIQALQSYCKEAEGFRELLVSPIIAPGKKKTVFRAVLAKQLSPSTLQLFDLLVTNNREAILMDINLRFISLYKQSKGIRVVGLYTAIPFDQSHTDTIHAFMEEQLKGPIELTVKVKPELLGGFILTVDDKMVDASLSAKLRDIKKKLLN